MNASTSDSQQRILDAACGLFYARSYADVGVAEICEQAGVQKGSFYHFFPSKHDLTLAVLDAHYAYFKEHLLDRAFAADLPPFARLERFATFIYELQTEIQKTGGRVLGCAVGNLANELASQDEPIRERINHIFHKTQFQIRQVLQEACDAGELPGIDTEATAQAMLAYFEGVMMLAKTQNDPEVLRALLPSMAQIRIPSPN